MKLLNRSDDNVMTKAYQAEVVCQFTASSQAANSTGWSCLPIQFMKEKVTLELRNSRWIINFLTKYNYMYRTIMYNSPPASLVTFQLWLRDVVCWVAWHCNCRLILTAKRGRKSSKTKNFIILFAPDISGGLKQNGWFIFVLCFKVVTAIYHQIHRTSQSELLMSVSCME